MTEAVKDAVGAKPITDEQAAQWRKDTPGCANRIHLNNAGSGLMPQAVLNAITGHLNREANFGGYESEDEAAPAIVESSTPRPRSMTPSKQRRRYPQKQSTCDGKG